MLSDMAHLLGFGPVGEGDDEVDRGHRDGGEGDPEAAGLEVVLVDLALAGPDLGRRHVHDVVLLEVVGRGVEDRGARQVQGVDLPLAVLLADDLHVFALAVDGEVAGQGEGLEDGDLVTGDVVGARGGDLSEDGDLEVQELDRVDGVLNISGSLWGRLYFERAPLHHPSAWAYRC